MGRSIIDSTSGGEDEVRRWFEEGRTYAWMVEEYERKYGLPVSPTMFSNRAGRRGWARRIARDEKLIPWDVREEHRHHRYLVLLRYEARRRAGFEMRDRDERELDGFLADLKELGGVVHYDPESVDGFYTVPREPQDRDLIREPPRAGRSRRQPTR